MTDSTTITSNTNFGVGPTRLTKSAYSCLDHLRGQLVSYIIAYFDFPLTRERKYMAIPFGTNNHSTGLYKIGDQIRPCNPVLRLELCIS